VRADAGATSCSIQEECVPAVANSCGDKVILVNVSVKACNQSLINKGLNAHAFIWSKWIPGQPAIWPSR
jgi:hypothetical protein